MNIHQVTTLPATLEADAIYFVLNGNYCETYVTNNVGEAKLVGNSTMINDLITTKTSNLSGFKIVTNIAERDALTVNSNQLVLVTNAAADNTVSAGAAMYAYDKDQAIWVKLTEFESFNENIALNWGNIQDKPTSTVAAIDTAVAKVHDHANKTQLDLIGGTANNPQYNGKPIVTLQTNNW